VAGGGEGRRIAYGVEEGAVKIKMLLCNCKGLCPSFKQTDMNTLPFQIESELDVEYTVLHPQLCGQGGNAILEDVLRAADDDTYVVVGACAPEAQEKLFKKVLRTTGFDERRLVSVDIRGTDNDGILDRLRGALEGVLRSPQEVAAG
jgi:heterodisulfide reductase subunit A-like polyferredoxin